MAESQNPYEKPPPYYTPAEGHGYTNEKSQGPYSEAGGKPSDPGNYGVPPPYYEPGQGQLPEYPPINPAYGGGGVPNYGSTVYVQQPQVATTTTQVIIVGGCPACRIGVLEDDFTCLGILMAIFCFPVGILCCLAMRQRQCPNCGAIFG